MTGTALMPRATIEEIVTMRTDAIALFRDGYNNLRDARALARKAAPKGFLATYPDRIKYMLEGCGTDQGDDFEAAMTKVVDRAVWEHIVATMGMERLMDAKARDQFQHQLRTDPPEVSVENCFATVEALLADAGTIFKRGVANTFSKLDRRFRSHDGFRIGTRIILDLAISQYGGWSSRGCDAQLRDVERAFYVLDGKEQPERYAGIIGAIDAERINNPKRSFTTESEYFRVRAFANGNLHIYFLRDDLVEKVNKLLAEYYGAALGAGSDVAPKKHRAKTGIAKNYGFFPTPDGLADEVIDRARLRSGMTVLEPNAGTGALSRRALDKGCAVTSIEIQPDLVQSLEADARYTTVVGMDFLDVDPELIGQFERVIMNPPFDGGRDVDHVDHALGFLAPGGILVAIMSAGVEFRNDAKTRDFRAKVEGMRGRFEDLPPGSFAECGTMVNTVLLTLRN